MQLLHDIPYRLDELFKLPVCDDQGRGRFEDHEMIAAYLREDSMVAEKPHHDNLAEHAGVNLTEGFEGYAQAHSPR